MIVAQAVQSPVGGASLSRTVLPAPADSGCAGKTAFFQFSAEAGTTGMITLEGCATSL